MVYFPFHEGGSVAGGFEKFYSSQGQSDDHDILKTPSMNEPSRLSNENPDPTPPPKVREEPKFFTIWVHVGYTVLILSTITWIIYLEYFLD